MYSELVVKTIWNIMSNIWIIIMISTKIVWLKFAPEESGPYCLYCYMYFRVSFISTSWYSCFEDYVGYNTLSRLDSAYLDTISWQKTEKIKSHGIKIKSKIQYTLSFNKKLVYKKLGTEINIGYKVKAINSEGEDQCTRIFSKKLLPTTLSSIPKWTFGPALKVAKKNYHISPRRMTGTT